MLHKTIFHVAKMDCSAEEQLIRMKLADHEGILRLEFDLSSRQVAVFHHHDNKPIAQLLDEVQLGARRLSSSVVDESMFESTPEKTQRNLLWAVLLINFGCFVLEIITGFISRSISLIADSLDMLADALVYSLALLAVGKTIGFKKNVAKVSGYLQLLLAGIGLAEVIRRFFGLDVAPSFTIMIGISCIALVGNVVSLWLLQKSKSTDVHMKASMIFTSNDIIINLGIIIAGGLVYFTGSNKPDLIIGIIVFVIVFKGALRILRLGR